MIKYLRIPVYLLAVLLGGILLYLSGSYILSRWHTHPKKECMREEAHIFTRANGGVHIEIIIPFEYLGDSLRSGLKLDTTRRFTAFSWGEKAFYTQAKTWDNLSIKGALSALFLPTKALMRVRSFKQEEEDWVRVGICSVQLERLSSFLLHQFKTDTQGKKQRYMGFHYAPGDYFYYTRGRYSLFYTCNTWVNEAFKKAGIPTALWTPFASGIQRHLKRPPTNTRSLPRT